MTKRIYTVKELNDWRKYVQETPNSVYKCFLNTIDALTSEIVKARLDEHDIICVICSSRLGLHKDGYCRRGAELRSI